MYSTPPSVLPDWVIIPPIVTGDVPGTAEVIVKFQLPSIVTAGGVGGGLGGVGVGAGGVGLGLVGAGLGAAPAAP